MCLYITITIMLWMLSINAFIKHYSIIILCYHLVINIQDFRYWKCTFILDCFVQLVCPLSHGLARVHSQHICSDLEHCDDRTLWNIY